MRDAIRQRLSVLRHYDTVLVWIGAFLFSLSFIPFFHSIYGGDPFIRLLNHEHIFVRHWFPVFQSLLWVYFRFSQNDIGIFVLMASITASACMMLYRWSNALFDRPVGIVAVLLIACNSLFAVISRIPYSECLTIVFMAATLYCFEKKRLGWAWIFFLVACLTRTEAVVLIAPLSIRLWQLYGSQKSIRLSALFSIPPIISVGMLWYLLRFPPHAFDPATYSVIGDVRLDVMRMATQVVQFIIDSGLIFSAATIYGIFILLRERKWQSVYMLVPMLSLVHALLNSTTFTVYAPRNTLIAYVFFAPYAAYALLHIARAYTRTRPAIYILITMLTLTGISSTINTIKEADEAIQPWKTSGTLLMSHFKKDARVLVLPLYDPTGLEWLSWRYIVPLYFSHLSLEKNIVIDQRDTNTETYQLEIMTGGFDGVIVSNRNRKASEAVDLLEKSRSLEKGFRFPDEFAVFFVRH